MAISIKELLELADVVLSADEGLDQGIEAIARYSDAFAGWQAAGMPAGKAAKAELKKLHDRHARVVKQAAEFQAAAHKSLGEFRKKTRGLKAYLDVFPVSGRRPRSRKG